MSAKIITVVGATGAQGGSIVNTLLKSQDYTVRAVTRNPESDSAKALAAKGAQLVQADVEDVSSLIAAFQGSHAVFAVTNFFEPFAKSGADKAIEVEVQQGKNLADAAAATSTLEHFVWSTLPDGRTISGGKYVVPHFEAKNQIDRYIKSNEALLAKTTFLWVTYYASNYYFPMYTPYHIPTAGKYIQIQSTPADTPVFTIGDVHANVGPIVAAILAQPEKTLNGTFVQAYTEETSAGELLQTWAQAQNKTAQYVQVDRSTFNALWPGWSEEMGVMMEFWDSARDKSWSGEARIITAADLGVKDLVGAKEAFAALKF